MAQRYDCIIIGGGHNGLVAAAYLAKAGKSVCVCERRHVLGGCASTEELWPGFKASPAAYVISLFLPSIIKELKLRENGLSILPRSPSSFTPLPDGRRLLLGHDKASNQREISTFSQADAEAYPRYEAMLTRVATTLEPMLSALPPGVPPRLRDAPAAWRWIQSFKSLDGDLHTAVELLTAAASPILDRWFESDPVKATLATDAIIGAFASPSMPGTAYVLLHHVMGEAGGARGVWGYVQGGMGGLADAIETSCRQLGVTIQREQAIERINISNGRATGVTLHDGTVIEARTVASSVDAHLTFERFIGFDHLPEQFAERVKSIDYRSASAKINFALSELPNFESGDVPLDVALRGTTHIAPTVEYIERAYDDAKYGRPSHSPVIEMTIPSTVDPTIAPPGQHVASMFVQYAPYEIDGRAWTEADRDAYADRCIDILTTYAPNFRDIVLQRQVMTPADLESTYGLTGGNIFQGAMHLHQFGPFRLPHRTPIRGLYLCGAATHPGGGVMGACGRNAAQVILRDGI